MLFPTHVRGTWYVKSSWASGLSFVNLLQPPPGSGNRRWLLPRWSPTSEGPLCPHSSDGLCKAASWWKQNWVRPGRAQVKPQVKRASLLLPLIPWREVDMTLLTEYREWKMREFMCIETNRVFGKAPPAWNALLFCYLEQFQAPPPIAISSCKKPSLIRCSQSTWHNA